MRRAIACLLLAACGPATGPGQAGTTGGSTASSTTLDSGSLTTSDPATTNATGSDTEADATGTAFLIAPDAGSASRCSLWGNECAAGEKCMPWANDGGDEINATRCVPIAEDAKAIGEFCTFASELSGIDDCVLGAMCWGGDRGNDGGRCVPFCRGSESNPICDDPCDFCSITGESVFNLCLPSCDPIAQNCTAGEACYPVGDTFRCFMDLSGEQGGVGDPCDHLVQCDPGTFCASAEMVPGCKGAAGCCAPFCDASATDECDAVWPGTTCVPRFGEALGPEACIGTALIGACMVVP